MHSTHRQNKVAMKERQQALSCYSSYLVNKLFLYLGWHSDPVTQCEHGDRAMKLYILTFFPLQREAENCGFIFSSN